MRGRKPKQSAVKDQVAAVRSRRKAPVAEAVATVTVGGVAPPKSVKGLGLALWNKLAPSLVMAKLLTPSDVPAFARYCRLTARWEEAEATIDKEGLTYESDSTHGKLKRAHPATMISLRYSRELMALETQFGLLPAERQRIMAARAQTGVTGDLFAAKPDAAETNAPPPPSGQAGTPLGLLN